MPGADWNGWPRRRLIAALGAAALAPGRGARAQSGAPAAASLGSQARPLRLVALGVEPFGQMDAAGHPSGIAVDLAGIIEHETSTLEQTMRMLEGRHDSAIGFRGVMAYSQRLIAGIP